MCTKSKVPAHNVKQADKHASLALARSVAASLNHWLNGQYASGRGQHKVALPKILGGFVANSSAVVE